MPNVLHQIRTPQRSDKKQIALARAAEALGMDSERYRFKQRPRGLVDQSERAVSNRRRRQLGFKPDAFGQPRVAHLTPAASCYLIDSLPLDACTLCRAQRSRMCQDSPSVTPDSGYCAAQQSDEIGDKLHALCTAQGVVKTFDLSKASCHDIDDLTDVKAQVSDGLLVGDTGDVSRQWPHDVFDTSSLERATPMRQDQPGFKQFSPSMRKAHKRIETLFSQRCDRFMIRRNYARSCNGFATRILSKITARTIIQWVNPRHGNNINNLKIVVA